MLAGLLGHLLERNREARPPTQQPVGPLHASLSSLQDTERSQDYPDFPAATALLANGEPDFEAINRRKRLCNSFGNLTLLTKGLNSSISNGPFPAKRREICLQSRLQLNAYFQKYTDEDKWTEETIQKRGVELFELAAAVWPFPTKSTPASLSSSGSRPNASAV